MKFFTICKCAGGTYQLFKVSRTLEEGVCAIQGGLKARTEHARRTGKEFSFKAVKELEEGVYTEMITTSTGYSYFILSLEGVQSIKDYL